MNNYELNNIENVQLFLQESTSIVTLVNDTFYKIHDFFLSVNKITLEVFTDPEDNKKNLIARIFPDMPLVEALSKLDIFDQQWFAAKFI